LGQKNPQNVTLEQKQSDLKAGILPYEREIINQRNSLISQKITDSLPKDWKELDRNKRQAFIEDFQNKKDQSVADFDAKEIAKGEDYKKAIQKLQGMKNQSFGDNLKDELSGRIRAAIVAPYAGVQDVGLGLVETLAHVESAITGKDPLETNLSQFAKGAREQTAEAMGDKADTITAQILRGAGSSVGFMAAGSSMPAIATIGALQSFGSGYREAREMGATGAKAYARAAISAGLGTTEALPIGHALERLEKIVPGSVKKFLVNTGAQFVEEGLQEGGQDIAQDYADKWLGLSNKDWKEIFGDGLSSAAIAGVSGMLFGGALNYANLRSAKNQTQKFSEQVNNATQEYDKAGGSEARFSEIKDTYRNLPTISPTETNNKKQTANDLILSQKINNTLPEGSDPVTPDHIALARQIAGINTDKTLGEIQTQMAGHDNAISLAQQKAQEASKDGGFLVGTDYEAHAKALEEHAGAINARADFISGAHEKLQSDSDLAEVAISAAQEISSMPDQSTRTIATGIAKLANGQPVEHLTGEEKTAILQPQTTTDPITGEQIQTPPLVRIEQGQPVITDAATRWMEESAPITSQMIPLDETGQLRNIYGSEHAQQAEPAQQASKTASTPQINEWRDAAKVIENDINHMGADEGLNALDAAVEFLKNDKDIQDDQRQFLLEKAQNRRGGLAKDAELKKIANQKGRQFFDVNGWIAPDFGDKGWGHVVGADVLEKVILDGNGALDPAYNVDGQGIFVNPGPGQAARIRLQNKAGMVPLIFNQEALNELGIHVNKNAEGVINQQVPLAALSPEAKLRVVDALFNELDYNKRPITDSVVKKVAEVLGVDEKIVRDRVNPNEGKQSTGATDGATTPSGSSKQGQPPIGNDGSGQQGTEGDDRFKPPTADAVGSSPLSVNTTENPLFAASKLRSTDRRAFNSTRTNPATAAGTAKEAESLFQRLGQVTQGMGIQVASAGKNEVVNAGGGGSGVIVHSNPDGTIRITYNSIMAAEAMMKMSGSATEGDMSERLHTMVSEEIEHAGGLINDREEWLKLPETSRPSFKQFSHDRGADLFGDLHQHLQNMGNSPASRDLSSAINSAWNTYYEGYGHVTVDGATYTDDKNTPSVSISEKDTLPNALKVLSHIASNSGTGDVRTPYVFIKELQRQLVQLRVNGNITENADARGFLEKVWSYMKGAVAALQKVGLNTKEYHSGLDEAVTASSERLHSIQEMMRSGDSNGKETDRMPTQPETKPLSEGEQALKSAFSGMEGGSNASTKDFKSNLPVEKMGDFMGAAQKLVAEGVKTPEQLSSTLERIGGANLHDHSNAVWGLMRAFDQKLENEPNWQEHYDKAIEPTEAPENNQNGGLTGPVPGANVGKFDSVEGAAKGLPFDEFQQYLRDIGHNGAEVGAKAMWEVYGDHPTDSGKDGQNDSVAGGNEASGISSAKTDDEVDAEVKKWKQSMKQWIPEHRQIGLQGVTAWAAARKAELRLLDDRTKTEDSVKAQLEKWKAAMSVLPRSVYLDQLAKVEEIAQKKIEQINSKKTPKPLDEFQNTEIHQLALKGRVEGPDTPHRRIVNSSLDAAVNAAKTGTKFSFNDIADTKGVALVGGRKVAEEHIEAGITAAAHVIFNQPDVSNEQKFQELVRMHEAQPTLGAKTSESKVNQAYSTPAPLALAATLLAKIHEGKVINEPTSGHGMLLMGVGTDHEVHANELDPNRLQRMKDYVPGAGGWNLTSEDATQRNMPKAPDRYIANPPFGQVMEEDGGNKKFQTDAGTTTSIDHAIVLNDLVKMDPNGRAVLIIGGPPKQVASEKSRKDFYGGSGSKGDFYRYLYDNYGVLDHFTVNGDLYRKQGAGWPVDVITIQGKKPSGIALPSYKAPRMINTWGDLWKTTQLTDEQRIEQNQVTAEELGGKIQSLGDKLAGISGGRGGKVTVDLPPPSQNQRPPLGQGGVSGESSRPPGRDQGSERDNQGAGGVGGEDLGGAGNQTGAGNKRLDNLNNGEGAQPNLSNESSSGSSRSPGLKLSEGEQALKDAFQGLQAASPPTPPEDKYKASLPSEKMGAFMGAAQKLVAEGVKTPEQFAAKLHEIGGENTHKYSNAVWGLMRAFDQKLENEPNWQEHYDKVTAPKEPKEDSSLPPPEGKDDPLTPTEESFQAPYTPHSGVPALTETLIPRNLAGPTERAFAKIKDEVGNIADFVRTQLGFGSHEEMVKCLDGTQVDTIASALWNFGRGGALIIGDQTGLGKGRSCGGIIRWAEAQGLIPVFISEDSTLHDAMFTRDLPGVGAGNIRPAILDTKMQFDSGKEANLDFGEQYFKNVAATGKLHNGSNAIFCTYSQLRSDNAKGSTKGIRNSAKASKKAPPGGWRTDALMKIAPNAVFILDESHNAAGQSTTGFRTVELLQRAKHVVYSSATAIKTPENMPLYFRTNLGKIADGDHEKLLNLFKEGGVPAMQISCNMLAEDGQYLRREMSFEGVNYSTVVSNDTKERDIHLSDELTGSLRHILDFQVKSEKIADAVNDILASVAKQAKAAVGNPMGSGSDFASKLHNIVSQYLLAMKAESGARQAIKHIQEGKKVFLTVHNTMESVMNKVGAGGFEMSYKGLLQHYLDGMRQFDTFTLTGNPNPDYAHLSDRQLQEAMVQIVHGFDIGTQKPTKTAQIVPEAASEFMRRHMWKAYEEAEENVKNADLGDLPISPIDHIRNVIEKAGHNTEEITGRTTRLDSDGSTYQRPASERRKQAHKVKAIDNFNNSTEHNFLLGNQSASTGISLHSDVTAKDQRQRVHIVLQASPDINKFMQTLGRTNRKGQVNKPDLIMMTTALPAEFRPAAINAQKLKKLNANTTSNADSDVTQGIQTVDLFNKYGDKIVYDELAKDPSLQSQIFKLGGSMVKYFDRDTGRIKDYKNVVQALAGEPDGYLAKNITSYLSVLNHEQQTETWGNSTDEYNGLIAYLDSIGRNDLEARPLDLQAKIISSEQLTPAGEGDSAFSRASHVDTVEAKMGKDPISGEEAQGIINSHNGGNGASNDPETQDAVDKLSKAGTARIASDLAQWKEKAMVSDEALQERSDKQQATFDKLQEHISKIGKPLRYKREDGSEGTAIIEKLDLDHGRPLTPSAQKFILKTNDSASRTLTVPGSQMDDYQIRPLPRGNPLAGVWDRETDKSTTRSIVGGNLLAAMAEGTPGRVIDYTKEGDDGTHLGIMLPDCWTVSRARDNESKKAINSEADWREMLDKRVDTIRNSDGNILMRPSEIAMALGIHIEVPANKADGGKYWRSPKLNALTARGMFDQKSNKMVAEIPEKNIIELYRVLDSMGEKLTYIPRRYEHGPLGLPAAPLRTSPEEKMQAIRDKMAGRNTLFAAPTPRPPGEGDGELRKEVSDAIRNVLDLQDLAKGEKSGERTIGNPKLALGGLDSQIMGVDEYRKTIANPEKEAQWHAEGKEMIANDYAGTRQKIMDSGMNGGTLNPSETKAAQMMVAKELAGATTDKAKRAELAKLIYAYRLTGAEQARGLRSRVDPFQSKADRHREFLAKMIFSPSASESKLIEREKDPAKKQAALTKAVDDKVEQVKKTLEGMGVSLDDILNGEVNVSLVGSKVSENILGTFKSNEQMALRLLQKGKTFENAAKVAGLSVKQVESLKKQFQESFRNRHGNKFIKGMKPSDIEQAPGLKAARVPVPPEEAEANFQKALELMGMGADAGLAKMKPTRTFNIEDPVDAIKVAKIAAAQGGNPLNMVHEYWMASILSGTATHAANIGGMAVNGAIDYTLQRGMEALVNSVLRRTDGTQMGEFKHIMKGVIPGVSNALRAGLRAWDAEQSMIDYDLLGHDIQLDQGQIVGHATTGSIKGKTGRVIRIPMRALGFMDDACKTIIAHMEVGAQAYRIAKAQGLEGDEMARFIKSEVTTTGSQSWEKAVKHAVDLSFQTRLRSMEESRGNAVEGAAEAISRGLQNYTPGRFFIPFVRIMYNIPRVGLRKSPVGTATLLWKLGREGFYSIQGGKGNPHPYAGSEMVRDVAEQVLAWTLLAALWGIAAGDDDDDKKKILITGSDKAKARGQRELAERTGTPAFHIKINGVTHNYGRIEPIATVLGSTVDLIGAAKAARDGASGSEVMGQVLGGIINQFTMKSFGKGLNDMLRVVTDPVQATDWAANLMASFVPNLIRQPIRATDAYVRETSIEGKPKDLIPRMAQRVGQAAFPFGFVNEPKINLYGSPVKKEGSVASRMTPVQSKDVEKVEIADKLMVSWNNKHPDEMYAPSKLSRRFVDPVTGKVNYMDDSMYRKYAETAGKLFAMETRAAITPQMAKNPTEDDHELLKKLLEQSRKEAKEQVLVSMRPKSKTIAQMLFGK
jgi:hypothetical protein